MNAFTTLAVPAGNGVGAAVNVSSLAKKKTFIITGTFEATVTLEASTNAGVSWAPVKSYTGPTVEFPEFVADQVRIRVSGYVSGTPAATIGAEDVGGVVVSLAVPAGAGVGAGSDVSRFGKKTVIVSGAFGGTITIEGTIDGTNWGPIMSFTQTDVQDTDAVVRQIRVRTSAGGGAATVSISGEQTDLQPFIAYGSSVALEIYVDATNGSDGNTGIDSTHPLQTIEAIWEKFPQLYFGQARATVFLAGPAGFTGTQVGVLDYPTVHLFIGHGGEALRRSVVFRGPTMSRITPTSGPAFANITIITNTTAFITTITVGGAPGWTADDFVGSLVRITPAAGGNMRVFELPIVSNGVDTIQVLGRVNVGAPVIVGDLVEIVRPAARVIGNSVDNFNQILVSGIAGAGFGLLPPSSTQQFSTFERVGFGNLIVATDCGSIGFDRCTFEAGATFYNSGYGFVHCGVPAAGAGGVILGGGSHPYSTNVQCRPDAAANPTLQTNYIDLVIAGQIIVGGFNAGSSTAYFPRGLWCSDFLGNDLVIVDGPGSLLYMEAGAPIAGDTAAGGAGIRCRRDGKARINSNVATPNISTITVGAAALQVEYGAAIDYGIAAGQFEEVAGYAGNFTRVLEGASAAAPRGDNSAVVIAA